MACWTLVLQYFMVMSLGYRASTEKKNLDNGDLGYIDLYCLADCYLAQIGCVSVFLQGNPHVKHLGVKP